MANSVIHDSKFVLVDQFPGAVNWNLGIPTGGFTGSTHHNVAAAAYPVGTKIAVYDATAGGYATMIYGQYIAGTKAATLALAAKQFVAIDTNLSATATAEAVGTYYKLGDDGSECLVAGPLAVAISAMTTAYYGWFWCGGVCPYSVITALAGDYVTDGTVTAAGPLTGAANASLTSTQGDKIILKLAVLAAGATSATKAQVNFSGLALKADD